MSYIAAHALNLALLLLLFHATGRLVVRAAGGGRGVAGRTGLLPIALGLCAWCYWLMALASAGLFTRGMLIAPRSRRRSRVSLRLWRRPSRLRSAAR